MIKKPILPVEALLCGINNIGYFVHFVPCVCVVSAYINESLRYPEQNWWRTLNTHTSVCRHHCSTNISLTKESRTSRNLFWKWEYKYPKSFGSDNVVGPQTTLQLVKQTWYNRWPGKGFRWYKTYSLHLILLKTLSTLDYWVKCWFLRTSRYILKFYYM